MALIIIIIADLFHCYGDVEGWYARHLIVELQVVIIIVVIVNIIITIVVVVIIVS